MNSADSQRQYERPELRLEGRIHVLAIVLIVVAVYVVRLSIEIDFLNRRMTKAEAAVSAIKQAHTTP